MTLNAALDFLAKSTAALAPLAPALLVARDEDLLHSYKRLSEARRQIDAVMATAAAELARRSHHELGHSGLAQRLGARTPERLVQDLSGVSKREASILVRVGELVQTERWMAPVATGALTIEAADVIHTGLGQPTEGVPAAAIAAAATRLAAEASTLTVEQLAVRARETRDDLDEAGVADRERERYESRYLRLIQQTNGMVRLTGLLDPESAALVTDAFHTVTTPRRSGPHFVSTGGQLGDSGAHPTSAATDSRTTEQLMLDGFVEMVRLAVSTDPGTLFGERRPAVRVLVAARDLERSAGAGHLEGQSAPVSIATVERHICASGSQTIAFDSDGQPLDVGRAQRMYTQRQRVALAARDGGCRFPGCERPPSWTEAHHIVPWSHGGGTDIVNGILLCRHHHLLLHNNGWRITRRGADYQVHPPGSSEPLPMPTRSAAWRAMRVPA